MNDTKSDEVVRRVFPEILNRKNKEELIWLSQALHEMNIWNRCSNASKGTFRDRIEKEIQEADVEEVREQLESMARQIGIETSKIDVENDESVVMEKSSEKE